MLRRLLVIASLLAFVVAPSIGSAWVSGWTPFSQQDLQGTWEVQVWGGCPSGTQCWNQCTLTISSDGSVQSGGIYTDCSGAGFEILGGQLSLSPDGDVVGTIEIDSQTLSIGPGAILEEGQLILSSEPQ
jgi:hypothetical protein